jgi:hypothetical protein
VFLLSESTLLVQNLAGGEQLLFSSEKAEIRSPQPHERERDPVANRCMEFPRIKGALAITDRRIYLIQKKGVFSREGNFEAIFSPDYARQLVKETMIKNEELKQAARGLNSRFSSLAVFFTGTNAQTEFLNKNGYKFYVDILSKVTLDRSVLGQEILLLQAYHAWTDSEWSARVANMRRSKEAFAGANKVIAGLAFLTEQVDEFGRLGLVSLTHKLRIERPLIMASEVATMDFTGANQWLIPIIQNYKEKTNVTYGPLIDIMQAKEQEMSEYIKEYEDST